MPVYLINSYDVDNAEMFKQYPPKVLLLLAKYGAEVLASDPEGVALEGKPKIMNAVIKFPSRDAVMNCYNDPEYQEIRKIRLASTSNCTMVIVKEFES